MHGNRNSNDVSIRDLTVGYDSTRPPDYKPVLPVDPNSQMITFTLDNHCIFTLRTSGTEPKIKYYVYMTFPPGTT
jgi:phosphomannomutase